MDSAGTESTMFSLLSLYNFFRVSSAVQPLPTYVDKDHVIIHVKDMNHTMLKIRTPVKLLPSQRDLSPKSPAVPVQQL